MIRLMKSTFYNEVETKSKLAEFILQSDRLSMADQCRDFERGFAEKQGRKYATFVSSGSMANLVLLQALINLGRLQQGDAVGVSALTWATNIMPVFQLGLKPIVLDCESNTLNVSANTVITHREEVKALFLTNVLGFSGDISQIKTACEENDILFLEDNCESLGSRVDGILLGNFGFASTFSTFVGHHLSTIEGGFICTDDEQLHDMILMVRAHGWDRDLDSKKQHSLRGDFGVNEFFARYTFYELAYNARPTEIQGFLGNEQLKYWNEIVTKRQKNFMRFHEKITENEDFIPLEVDHMDIISNFAMPVVCKDENKMNEYIEKFERSEIEIRPVIAGDMTKQPFFQKIQKDTTYCENADFIHKNGFYFPNNPELTEEEIDTIINIL